MHSEDVKKIQRIARPVLFPFSLIYGGFVNIRNALYDKNILKKQKYGGTKIISVGNIAAGGAGKTPVVIKLAEAMSKYKKVCVITGNYPTKDKRVHVVSIDGNILKKPPAVPDEAYMVAKKTHSTVISSKSRKAAIELAIGLNMNCIILDDALHKKNIEKDAEICVIDKEKPFEDGFYIPAGFLRDAKSTLKKCDITVCFNKTGHGRKSLDCYEAVFLSMGVFNSAGEKIEKPESAFVFCGIGKPASFLRDVEKFGIEIKGHKFFKDHHTYSKRDLNNLYMLKKKYGAKLLLTTYKDFVKMENEDVCYFDVDVKIEKLEGIVKGLL